MLEDFVGSSEVTKKLFGVAIPDKLLHLWESYTCSELILERQTDYIK